MKAILISIQPKWVAKILNGEKTLEIRKSYPKCDLPIDVYIYVTKGNKHECLEYADNPNPNKEGKWVITSGYPYANGKVVAKFTLNKCEYIYHDFSQPKVEFETDSLKCQALLKKSCLIRQDTEDYIKMGKGYAWHIDDLVIFDKPKEISEFRTKCWKSHDVFIRDCYRQLTRAPQSWCYVEF